MLVTMMQNFRKYVSYSLLIWLVGLEHISTTLAEAIQPLNMDAHSSSWEILFYNCSIKCT